MNLGVSENGKNALAPPGPTLSGSSSAVASRCCSVVLAVTSHRASSRALIGAKRLRRWPSSPRRTERSSADTLNGSVCDARPQVFRRAKSAGGCCCFAPRQRHRRRARVVAVVAKRLRRLVRVLESRNCGAQVSLPTCSEGEGRAFATYSLGSELRGYDHHSVLAARHSGPTGEPARAHHVGAGPDDLSVGGVDRAVRVRGGRGARRPTRRARRARRRAELWLAARLPIPGQSRCPGRH
jgi:hypothetical protein